MPLHSQAHASGLREREAPADAADASPDAWGGAGTALGLQVVACRRGSLGLEEKKEGEKEKGWAEEDDDGAAEALGSALVCVERGCRGAGGGVTVTSVLNAGCGGGRAGANLAPQGTPAYMPPEVVRWGGGVTVTSVLNVGCEGGATRSSRHASIYASSIKALLRLYEGTTAFLP